MVPNLCIQYFIVILIQRLLIIPRRQNRINFFNLSYLQKTKITSYMKIGKKETLIQILI